MPPFYKHVQLLPRKFSNFPQKKKKMFSKNRSHLFSVCNSVADQLWPSLKPTVRRKYQLLRRRCYSSSAGILLRSDYGAVTVPQLNVPQFIWKNSEKWGDKPMVVRICCVSLIICVLSLALILSGGPLQPSDPNSTPLWPSAISRNAQLASI